MLHLHPFNTPNFILPDLALPRRAINEKNNHIYLLSSSFGDTVGVIVVINFCPKRCSVLKIVL